MMMERKLDDILPVLGVEHDCIASKMGDITIGFEVKLPEIYSLSAGDYEAFHQSWVKAIKNLPKKSVFHKQDWFIEATYRADFSKSDTSMLTRSSERFFNERPFLDHSCYIYLTKKPEGRKLSSSLVSNLTRRSLVPGQMLHPSSVQEFLDSAGQFVSILEDSGFIKLRRLGDSDLKSTREKAGVIERYCFLLEPGQLAIRDISFTDGIRIGDEYCQLYTLSNPDDLPGVCGSRINYERYCTDRTKFSVGFAANLGQLLSCNHIYNQFIFLDDPTKMIQDLERKRLRLQSLSTYSRENSIARDATSDFLNEAMGEQRLPVKAHFDILAWTDSRDKIKEIKNRVSSGLAQIDAVPKQEISGAPQIFWAAIPGNEADFPMNDTFDTFAEQASCFLNLETSYRSSLSPVGIRLGDRLTGKPLHVDISDEPMKTGMITNRNKFILGPSGSGKSFLTNHLARSYYEQGAHIVIVDVGHSYKGLCELLGGKYLTYTEQEPIRFNPFYIDENETLDIEKRESIKNMLFALWKKDDENFQRSEYVALSNAVQLYYEMLDTNPSVFAGFNSFFEFVERDFTRVLKKDRVKDKDFDIDNFLYVLRPFYKGGEYDYLLNATENLDLLNDRFIVFELDNIKDIPVLFSVTTIILMSVFISKMRKLKGVRKLLFLEEVWKALTKTGMEQAIQYWVKTIRKFFGELITITQEIEDIISSKIVKNSIINNSDCKILLDQSKYQNKFDIVQELLGLTESQKIQVLSLNKSNEPGKFYKEVYLLGRVYRLEVSKEEYLAYTTEETEKVKVQDYAKRHGGIEKGIVALALDLKTKN